MGTSTPFGGAGGGSPLVPDFVDDDASDANPSSTKPEGQTADPEAVPPAPNPRREQPAAPDGDRFRAARSNFSRFASSGSEDRRALGRAVSQYVSRSTGGSANAAHRMGSSRGTAARIAGFLGAIGTQGLQQALVRFNLTALAGRPATEIFAALADRICPEGGSIDEGIARDAFVETMIDLADAGITDLSALTPEQMQTVLELYITHSIEDRIYNDIGIRGVELPNDVLAAERVRNQLYDFIRGGVVDALNEAAIDFTAINPVSIERTIEAVYESSFDILEALGQEAGR